MANYLYHLVNKTQDRKATVADCVEVQPDKKLPPRRLQRWSKTSRFYRHLASALMWAGIVTAAIMYGLTKFYEESSLE